jgi:Fe-S cluster biogenesis protein NfuA
VKPIRIYRPEGDAKDTPFALTVPLASLAGRRIAVLDNGKPNAAFVMTRAAQYLAERTGATLALLVKKGPGGRSANAAIPCAPDVFAQVLEAADIVITGAADCGSCTAYSVSDTIQLERAGRPTVVVTTTHFEPVVDALAASGGLSSIRKLVLEHPIGGTDHGTLEQRARDATEQLIELFTGSHPTPDESRSPTIGDGLIDIEPLRALVAADGGDLELVGVDRVAGAVELRLVLPDASCQACVMPGETLAAIALDRLVPAHAGLRSVTVLDPRDDPDDQEVS